MASKHDIQAKKAQVDTIDSLTTANISVAKTLNYANAPATFGANDLITEARAEALLNPPAPVRLQYAVGTVLPIVLSSAWGTDYPLFRIPRLIVEYLTPTAHKWREVSGAQIDRQYSTDDATLTGINVMTNDDGTGHLADRIQITITT